MSKQHTSELPADKEIKVVRSTFAGCTREGEYQYTRFNATSGVWTLKRWRLTLDGNDVGQWHKVHGNRRNGVAGFSLYKDEIR